MGLFCSVIHIYQRSQEEVISQVSGEWQEYFGISTIRRIGGKDKEADGILGGSGREKGCVDYLITQPHGDWTTLIEVNVTVEPSFYLNELVKGLSKRLDTYALLIYLHDGDVLYYNLEKQGESFDGYNSDYQYFLTEPADRAEVLGQRHEPAAFAPLLPKGKTVEGLNALLNEGYWAALDNNDLDANGIPIEDDRYYIDEQERFEQLGKYLEIFGGTEYPFADWYGNKSELLQAGACLLRGEKNA